MVVNRSISPVCEKPEGGPNTPGTARDNLEKGWDQSRPYFHTGFFFISFEAALFVGDQPNFSILHGVSGFFLAVFLTDIDYVIYASETSKTYVFKIWPAKNNELNGNVDQMQIRLPD